MILFAQNNSSPISSASGTYHYEFARCGTNLAVISSDDHLRLVDPVTFNVVSSTVPGAEAHGDGITCLKAVDDENVIATAGRDGVVRMWDVRKGFGGAVWEVKDAGMPILSLAVSKSTNLVAAGTELTGQNAEIVVWDFERKQRMKYEESHNDDVTQIAFHPTQQSLLLSGSTDGLINIYDMTVTEEDDALYQVINHGSSINHAGFLSSTAVYGLSHDESLSVYKVADPDENIEEPAPVVFGDIREKLGCEYAIDVLLKAGELGTGILAVGSHSGRWLDMYSLKAEPTWNLGSEDVVRLDGAHRDEIVRCIYLDDATATVFTGGEDGLVKSWRANV